MPLTPFIANLRSKIGNDLLLLPSVSAIILDDAGRVLLQRARDDGKWYVIGGSMEPGEQPAQTVVREVKEETGLDVEPPRITGVYASEMVTYANGHRCEFVATVFLCRVIGGTLCVADDESLEFRYFDPLALPDLRPDHRRRIADALDGREQAHFVLS
jgi:8-oxo-dGTP diphosphatase